MEKARFKMSFMEMTIEELQGIYTKPAIRAEGDGYYLRAVGRAGQRYQPNLQIHVPCLGLPIESHCPIGLLRGAMFMSEVTKTMSLRTEHATGLLFCRNFRLLTDSALRGDGRICHVDLCDPEDAEYMLIAVYVPMEGGEEEYYCPNIWQSKSWSGRYDCGLDVIYYSLVPIGFRNLPDGEIQSPEDIAATRRKVISLANRYFGIEDDTEVAIPTTSKDSISSNSTDRTVETVASLDQATEVESDGPSAGIKVLNCDDGIHVVLPKDLLLSLPDNKPLVIEISGK